MDDLISRQAAIDMFQNLAYDDWNQGVSTSRADAYSECANMIRELPPAQPERWIPCSERLPEDLEEVNVTWVNHDFIKDKPFTATAVYYKENWYWYSSTCADILAEYGRNQSDEIDDGIEIITWMPLPEPYKGDES